MGRRDVCWHERTPFETQQLSHALLVAQSALETRDLERTATEWVAAQLKTMCSGHSKFCVNTSWEVKKNSMDKRTVFACILY